MKMDGSVFEKKSSFKMLGLTFSSKLGWGSYIVSLLKLPPRKFLLRKFFLFLLRLLCISISWNTVVMFGLVLQVAPWNYWISYKNGYAGLLVLNLLPS